MIKYHLKAHKELSRFNFEVRDKFKAYFVEFENNEGLSTEKFKKLHGTELYEFRIKVSSVIYRAIGGFLEADFIIVLIFKKQSQKTPGNILKLAGKRFNEVKC